MRLSIRQYAQGLLDLEKELEAGKVQETAERFFAWLVRRGEGKKMHKIVKEAERILSEQTAVAEVTITTAHGADTVTRDMLKRQAEKIFAPKKVASVFVADTNLIGGVRMHSEEMLYDASLSTSVKKLRTSLVG